MISVCIPTYNSARYLGDAIDSVLRQQLDDLELIIVDNNSNDNTDEVVGRYNDRRLTYHKFESIVSMADNWNRCLELAKGELICILHADDLLLPGYLTETIAAFANNQNLGMLFSAVNLIDEKNNVVDTDRAFDKDLLIRGKDIFAKHILGNFIYCPSVTVKKQCYSRLGKFNNQLKRFIDWEMWLRIELAGYDIAYMAKPLAAYRIHAQSATQSTDFVGTAVELSEWLMVMKKCVLSQDFAKVYNQGEAALIENRAMAKMLLRIIRYILRDIAGLNLPNAISIIKLLVSSLSNGELRVNWQVLYLMPQMFGKKYFQGKKLYD